MTTANEENPGGVRSLAAWHALVNENELHKIYSRFQALCESVSTEHVEELQTMRHTGDAASSG